MKKKRNFKIGLLLIITISGLICLNKLSFESGINSLEEINVSKIYSAIDYGENLAVYYGRESCSACRVFTPTLEKAAEIAEKKVYFLDGDNLETKGFSKDYNIQVTPTLLIVEKGKILRYEGVLKLDETVKILTEAKRKESAVWK